MFLSVVYISNPSIWEANVGELSREWMCCRVSSRLSRAEVWDLISRRKRGDENENIYGNWFDWLTGSKAEWLHNGDCRLRSWGNSIYKGADLISLVVYAQSWSLHAEYWSWVQLLIKKINDVHGQWQWLKNTVTHEGHDIAVSFIWVSSLVDSTTQVHDAFLSSVNWLIRY